MLRFKFISHFLLAGAVCMLLAACGGSSSDSNPSSGSTTYTIGGAVSGLSGSVVLQLNGGNNLTVSASGSFTFTTGLANAASYAVTVLTQPANQVCTVSSGTGTVSAANITSVTVTCVNATYSIGGTVSGLTSSGLVLQLNGANNLTVSASGSFTFTTGLANAASYAVTVLTQPTNQACTVGSGSGTVSAANVTSVTVTCVNTYSIGGTVSGLTSSGLVLQLNGANNLTVASGSTSFTFTTRISSGGSYAVTIATQPAAQQCTLSAASGTASANVTSVAVTCVNKYTVGGSISGLTADGLKISLYNATTSTQVEDLTVASGSTTFTFTTTFTASTTVIAYISDVNQPTGLTCIVGSAANTAGTANVTAIQVGCAPKTTSTLQGTYRIGATRQFFTFYANGRYVYGNHDGVQTDVEYGIYNWNAGTGVLTAPVLLVDTRDSGLTRVHDGNVTVNLVTSGSNLVLTSHETGFQDETYTFTPVSNTSGSLVGVWGANANPTDVLIYLGDGTFMNTVTYLNVSQNSGNSAVFNGIEDACYTSTGGTLTHTITSCIVDTGSSQVGIDANGYAGLINPAGTQPTWTYSVSGNTLTRTNVSSGASSMFTRVQ